MVAVRLKELEEMGADRSQIDELYSQMRFDGNDTVSALTVFCLMGSSCLLLTITVLRKRNLLPRKPKAQ